MRNPQSIEVEELILHILDSKNKRLQLSEIPIPKTGDPRIFEYFRSRIEDAAGDGSARPAKFQSLASYSASICLDLLKTSATGAPALVNGSQLLAIKLFGLLLKNRSIAPGDLAVCRYRATEDEVTESYLAILKIDPTEALRPIVKEDTTGLKYVTFDIETDVFPTLGERVQKCALVRTLDPRPPEFDLLLLDRQARPAAGTGVARFFTEDFLEAELAFDSLRSTVLFCDRLLRAQDQLRKSLSVLRQERFERQVQGVLSQEQVHIDEWIETVGLPETEQALLSESLAPAHLPEREFEIDREHADKVIRTRRFHGQNGLCLEVAAQDYGPAGGARRRKLAEWRRVSSATGPDYFEIVIRTETWEEK